VIKSVFSTDHLDMTFHLDADIRLLIRAQIRQHELGSFGHPTMVHG
jgi:hypothetical protein